MGLSEFKDGLVRRPAATWTIIKLDSEIDDVTCYVTGVEEKSKKEETKNESEKETGQVRKRLSLDSVELHIQITEEFLLYFSSFTITFMCSCAIKLWKPAVKNWEKSLLWFKKCPI